MIPFLRKCFILFFLLYCRLISLIYLSSRQNKCSAISLLLFILFFRAVGNDSEFQRAGFLFFIMMKAFLVAAIQVKACDIFHDVNKLIFV